MSYVFYLFIGIGTEPVLSLLKLCFRKREGNAESKNWQRVVSAALAAAVVTLSPVMPAVADLNKYEAETRGEFGIGSAAQFGSADLRFVSWNMDFLFLFGCRIRVSILFPLLLLIVMQESSSCQRKFQVIIFHLR